MDNDSSHFCTNCGAPLRDSDTFCTSCGANRSGRPAVSQNAPYGSPGGKSNRLMFMGILSALWAAFALIYGIFYIVNADSMGESAFSLLDPEFWDSVGITQEALAGIYLAVGAVLAVSGASALVTAITCFLKKFYIIGLIACIISSICGLIAIIGFIGFIVAYFISKSKNEFAENTPIR